MQINWLSTNKTEATGRTRGRSSTGRNTEMLDIITVLSCDLWPSLLLFFFFFCVWDWQMSETTWHCICTGWNQPPASPDSQRGPHVTTPGGGERGGGEGRGWDGVGITFLQLWRWVHGACPTVKGGPGLACTLNCPVTMGTEEWERKWKSAPSGLHITPSAGRASWEAILNAYSAAAAAVWVAVMCLKSRSSCLYSDPTVTSEKKELWKKVIPKLSSPPSHTRNRNCEIQIRFQLN